MAGIEDRTFEAPEGMTLVPDEGLNLLLEGQKKPVVHGTAEGLGDIDD